ncbi:hypothetical protein QE357_002968 [Siphonobacter sp. BAB-5404]|nr:hypothetical protein [Siphonobacter sp. SORGH_AS_0500]
MNEGKGGSLAGSGPDYRKMVLGCLLLFGAYYFHS